MIPVFQLGYVSLKSSDVQAMVHYYTDVLGCILVEQADDGTAYISTGLPHHNLIISPSTHRYMEGVGWHVNPTTSLQDVQQILMVEGIHSELQHDAQPGIKEQLTLKDPDGNIVHLFGEMAYDGPGYATKGIVPNKLGHLAISTKDAQKCVDFYHRLLGFHKTDRAFDLANFLTCNEEHHTINILQGKKSYLHHIAFQLRNPAHQYDSSDILMQHDIPTIWGPSRHTAGHNIASYHLDPDQNIIELYTDMDKYIPELNMMEPRPWHKDKPQKPKVWESFESWGTQFGDTLPTADQWKKDHPLILPL